RRGIEPPAVEDISRVDVLRSHALPEKPRPRLRHRNAEAEHIDRPRDRNRPPEQPPCEDDRGHTLGRWQTPDEKRSGPWQQGKVIPVIKEPQDSKEEPLQEPIEEQHRAWLPDPVGPPPEPLYQRGHEHHRRAQGEPEPLPP